MTQTNSKPAVVSQAELAKQQQYIRQLQQMLPKLYTSPKALVRTFGCQQNVADGQRLKGMLLQMGYTLTTDVDEADLIIYNTCAVREHAQDRVIGNIGALKHHKRRHPDCIIGVCGCMVQQPHITQRIQKSYPHVDLVFGTHVLHRLPELLYTTLAERRRVFEIPDMDGVIAEGVPVLHDGGVRGWLPVMYGCNNFCTYCVVPYVRGRERSRAPADNENDLRQMLEQGIKDITLLGQNVNSYNGGISFAQLLRRLNDIPGDFVLRFMTSHPKDCTDELLETMATCEKVERHLHLPVQSGNDRVLQAMNRHYDRRRYMELIQTARRLMPDIMLTSDIIVGFPGETYQEFLDTVDLVRRVRYHSLYTFIYSPRVGTPAAKMEDPVGREEKGRWFKELCDAQEQISAEICLQQVGKVFRALIESPGRQPGVSQCRTLCNQIIEIPAAPDLIGTFQNVQVTAGENWILKGTIIQ